MPEFVEYAQCPTCNAVFEKGTLYKPRENKDVAPSDEMGCIYHLKDWLGSDELAEKIRVETFAQREKELYYMRDEKLFLNWDHMRRENSRSYAQSFYADNKFSKKYAKQLFAYTLLKKSFESDITMAFFEITQNGMPLDIIDEMGFFIFSDTKKMIKEHVPQGIVDAYGPSSQITLISPGTFWDLNKLPNMVEEFNKKYSPSRRLLAIGFNYKEIERPYEQLNKLHDTLRKDDKQAREGAARAS
jgi:hypothetical protein